MNPSSGRELGKLFGHIYQNWFSLHAESVGIHTEKLENLRIAAAKDSPMWETLDLCLKHVDPPTLELLVPRLVQLVRSGVGLNTSCRVDVHCLSNSCIYTSDLDEKDIIFCLPLLYVSISVKFGQIGCEDGCLRERGDCMHFLALARVTDLLRSGDNGTGLLEPFFLARIT
eukprot:Gb_39357 [translate_table: standard]